MAGPRSPGAPMRRGDWRQSIGVRLLADPRDLCGTASGPAASAELVAALVAIEGRPWAEWGKAGKPITANGLARLLAPFGIVPDTIRTGDRTPKGCQLARFEDALERYLPDKVQRAQHRNKRDGTADFPRSATAPARVALRKTPEILAGWALLRCCG